MQKSFVSWRHSSKFKSHDTNTEATAGVVKSNAPSKPVSYRVIEELKHVKTRAVKPLKLFSPLHSDARL